MAVLRWFFCNPGTTFLVGLVIFFVAAVGFGCALSRPFRTSCGDCFRQTRQIGLDTVAGLFLLSWWIVWRLPEGAVRIVRHGCRWLDAELRRRYQWYRVCDDRGTCHLGGIESPRGSIWAALAIIVVSGFGTMAWRIAGLQLPHLVRPAVHGLTLTSDDDWQAGRLVNVTARNGTLELARSSGGAWEAVDVPTADYIDVLPLSGGKAIMAVDAMPHTVYFDGRYCHEEAVGGFVRCLACTDLGEIFAFSDEGTVFQRTGSSDWVAIGKSAGAIRFDHAVSNGGEIMAVGSDGLIAHYRDERWTAEELPTTGPVTAAGVLQDGTFVFASQSPVGCQISAYDNGSWQEVDTLPEGLGTVSVIGLAGRNLDEIRLATASEIIRRENGRWRVDETPLATCPPPDGNMVAAGDSLWYGASVGQSVRLLDGQWSTVPLPAEMQGIMCLHPDGDDVWGIGRLATLGAQVLRYRNRIEHVTSGTAVYLVHPPRPGDEQVRYRAATPPGTSAIVRRSSQTAVTVELSTTDPGITPGVMLLQVD